MSKATRISIWFVCCVSLGLALAYVDGATLSGIIKTAIGACALMVAALIAVAFLRNRDNKSTSDDSN